MQFVSGVDNYLRDPLAHTLKHVTNTSEMLLRKALPEGSTMFRAAKTFYYRSMTR